MVEADRPSPDYKSGDPLKHDDSQSEQVQVGERYEYSDERKIGITGSVFLILNKMIGTGSEFVCSSRDPNVLVCKTANPLLGSLLHTIGHFCGDGIGRR